MSTIVTRAGKGSPLTHNEVDANFNNLNTDKVEKTAAAITGGTINGTTIGATTPSTGVFSDLTDSGLTSGRVTYAGTGGNLKDASNFTYDGTNLQAGAIQNTPIGSTTASTGSFTTLNSTGGALNGTIGATTPSTGAFTDLTASGQSDLGLNGANNQTFRALAGTGAFPWVQTSHASGEARIRAAATSGAVTFSLSSLGSGTMRFYTDAFANEQFRIARTASSVNYVQVTGSALGVAPVVSVQGTDTNIPLVLQPKGTGALQAQQTDSTATGGNVRGANAVDWQTARGAASQVASAQLGVIGGGTNNTVTGAIAGVLSGGFSAASGQYAVVAGGAANTAGQYAAGVVAGQGNGALGYFNLIGGGFTNSGTSGSAVTTQSGTMNATTAVTLSGSNANIKVGQYISGTSIAADTYVAAISGTSLTLSKNASGSSTSTLSFFTPHGVVVGGGNNQATGAYSFIGGGGDAGTAANRNVASGDWSTVGGGQQNTASGIGAVVAGGGTFGSGGSGNTASGVGSAILGGWGNTASGTGASVISGNNNTSNASRTTVLGSLATARAINGIFSMQPCNSPISASGGINQTSILVLARQTTDATATALASDSSAAGTTNQVILPNNSAYFFTGEVISGVTGGGNTKGWTIEGVIKRGANAASTALVGTPTVTSMYADVGAATWTIAVTADTTNGGLRVTFTGQASTTIRTVCQIRTTEMTF